MTLDWRVKALHGLLCRPIAFHRVFVRVGGGVLSGLLLSQMYYWSRNQRSIERDGWFYKSWEEWQEETGLTRQEQRTARAKLVNAGLIEEKQEGLPSKLWYRVKVDVLADRIIETVDDQDGE